MAKDTKSNNYLTQSLSISPQSDLTIEDYIGTDRFGIYVHGTKGGWNDLPLEGCYHGDAWVVNQHVVMWSETEKQWVDLGVIAGVQGKTGPAGEQGVQGIQGEQGVQGERGLTGEQGAVGPQGIQGIQGPAGLGLYICGVLEDETDLQFQCVSRIGQTYFINRQAWMWDGEEFINLGEIQGVQGVAGPTGERGEQGLQGERGEKGERGETGAQGATGAQGIQGEQGEKGDTGDSVTLIVRDIHVGEPDTVPIINISSIEGKPPVQYIDFTIPQGKRGEPGVIGPPNYLEVAGVYTLPADSDARVEITNEQSYGVKLLTPDGTEYLMAVNSYGRLYTEPVTTQNDVPGSALSVLEVESDSDGSNTVIWELSLDSLGKVKLYNSDYTIEDEPEPDEGNDNELEEDTNEEYELLRVTKANKLVRTSTTLKPLVFIAPNKTHWRLGVTADTHQLYTTQVDDELVESDSYINQKITFFIPQGIQGVKGDIGLQGPINLITAGEIKILEEYEEPKVWIDQLEVEHAKEIPDTDIVLLADSSNVYQLGISTTGRLQAELLTNDQEYNPEQFIVLVDTETQKEYKVYIENSQLITEPVESGLYLSKQRLVLDYRSQEYYEVTICDTKITTKQLELRVIDDVIATVTQRLNLEIPRGKTGDKGEDGRSNYLRVSECVTLAEGEQATVEISEPFKDKDHRYTIQDIAFGLPMGERGPQGWAIDHKWEGTTLFIKGENDTEWGDGVNLKGDKGDSVTFEGGEIIGDTTFLDGRVNLLSPLFYNYQKMIELTTLDNKTAFGYENIIAKNALQVGYHRWDDRECIGANSYKHESCAVELPDNYYDSTDAVITLHTMYGDSTIKQRIDNVLELINEPQVQVSTDLFTYNSEEVATQPFVLGKVKTLTDRLDVTIGELDVDIRGLIAESLAESKQHTNTSIINLKNWTSNELTELRLYIDAQDAAMQEHLDNYVNKKLESLDITGKLTDYIEDACVKTYEQSIAESKVYTDLTFSEVTNTFESKLDEVLANANSHCNELVETTKESTLQYINDRDQYYFDLTTEKFTAVNTKIQLLELQTEELINQTVVDIYSDILDTNKRISELAATTTLEIDKAKTESFEYTESAISKLDIPAFKDNVAQKFDKIDERNTADEKNLEDTNIFIIESLTKVGEMFEELENKVNEYISLKDSNGIEWAIKVDEHGRLISMKKAKALQDGKIVRSESSMVQLLLDYIQILEQRITSLENK